MLNLGGLNDLANALGVDIAFLHGVLDDFDMAPDSLVDQLTLYHADQTKKPRDVIALRKRWRLLQERIYRKLLLPWFAPPPCCQGGVRGRSPATNARMHLGNTHVFLADISSFFPSIRCGRVNRLFLSKACHHKVANALTRLCTFDFHLALGLVTSPLIANEIMRPIDRDIGRFCKRHGLIYTRFIDDIAISGKFKLRKCYVEEAIEKTLTRHHFEIAKSKVRHGRLVVPAVRDRINEDDEQLAITGVRVARNHIDMSKDFSERLDLILADHLSLSNDGPFEGPLYLQDEVYGKAYYACSLNPGRRPSILGRMKQINWWKILPIAEERGLVRYRKRLTARGTPRPDCSEPLPLAAGTRFVREYYKHHSYDPTETPFDVTRETSRDAAG